MSQKWRDVSFAHWPVPVELVRAIIPEELEVDTFDGTAWVSLVGFEMDELRLRGFPAIPTTDRFLEFNVRTYVTGPFGPGVWFCSLDVAQWLPTLVARIGFALPYDKGAVDRIVDDGTVTWTVDRTWPDRASGRLVFESTGDAVAEVDELSVFLTSRWRLYASTRGGRLVSAPVEHEKWTLTDARVVEVDAGLATAAGLPVDGPAIAHHGGDVSVRVGRPVLVPRTRRQRTPIVVWFDEDCGLCSTSVRTVRPFAHWSVRFRPNHQLTDPTLRALSDEAIVVEVGSQVLTGVDAVAMLLSWCGLGGRLLAGILRLPGVHALASVIYRQVARNRGRISARLGLATGCDLPRTSA